MCGLVCGCVGGWVGLIEGGGWVHIFCNYFFDNFFDNFFKENTQPFSNT